MAGRRPGRRAVYVVSAGRDAEAGGIGRCVEALARGLPIVAPGLGLHHIDTRGASHGALAPFIFAAALGRIAMGAALGRVALLHVHLASRGSTLRKMIVVMLGSALGLPIVLHVHGALFDRFYRSLPPAAQAALRWMFGRAERVIALGPTWQRFLAAEVEVPLSRIVVIANGVTLPAAPASPAGGPPHVVFLGRLEARKGVTTLLAALASPALAGRAWTATLAGDGDRAAFADAGRRMGLASRLAFPGWVDATRVAELLAGASLLVLPSHAEGLPMAVIEALAHRVAVVTTPVGAIPDFLTDGVSAVLVPPGDAAALAIAMAGLLDDPERRARIAAAGHAVCARHFDSGLMCRAVAALYDDVLAGRPVAPDLRPVQPGTGA